MKDGVSYGSGVVGKVGLALERKMLSSNIKEYSTPVTRIGEMYCRALDEYGGASSLYIPTLLAREYSVLTT